MDRTRRGLLKGIAGAVLTLASPAFGADQTLLSGRAFGTSWRVLMRHEADVNALAASLRQLLARINGSMSPFMMDSAISRLNRTGVGTHPVDADLAVVAAEALRTAARTEGAFDPSVGPDVGRFGFGPMRGARSGTYRSFAMNSNAIIKSDPLATLDLCGIAKGYALDRMADEIRGAGIADFVVELGGEVQACGFAENGEPWRLGISNPQGGLFAAINARGLAVATSGDAINAFEIDGRRYSHIIDPWTDRPVDNAVASVTVLSQSGMTADALATALMVMGPNRGLEFASVEGLPVLYLLRHHGGLRAVSNHHYDRLVLN